MILFLDILMWLIAIAGWIIIFTVSDDVLITSFTAGWTVVAGVVTIIDIAVSIY